MRNENKIVIFDWGGVVESHKEGEYNYLSAKIDIINSLVKKELDKNTIIEKWNECNYDKNSKCISEMNKEQDIQEWFQRIRKSFDLKCNYDEFYDIYQEKLNKVDFYKEVVEFAHSLKEKCKIGILSNLCSLDKCRIDKHYNLSKFDYVWLSFEMEYKKPNEEIYIKVEQDCKIKPENILFIDDVIQNINTAKQRGWNVCHAYGYELDSIKKAVEEFLN